MNPDRFIFAIIALVILGCCYLGVLALTGFTTERACLEKGYPSSAVTVRLDRYCIKRVNQTDSVAALSKLR